MKSRHRIKNFQFSTLSNQSSYMNSRHKSMVLMIRTSIWNRSVTTFRLNFSSKLGSYQSWLSIWTRSRPLCQRLNPRYHSTTRRLLSWTRNWSTNSNRMGLSFKSWSIRTNRLRFYRLRQKSLAKLKRPRLLRSLSKIRLLWMSPRVSEIWVRHSVWSFRNRLTSSTVRWLTSVKIMKR